MCAPTSLSSMEVLRASASSSAEFPASPVPKLAGQPAVAENARTLQLQPAQAHLDAVDGIRRNFPVIGKQTQRGEALFGFVKHLQSLPPGGLLLVIDLA